MDWVQDIPIIKISIGSFRLMCKAFYQIQTRSHTILAGRQYISLDESNKIMFGWNQTFSGKLLFEK